MDTNNIFYKKIWWKCKFSEFHLVVLIEDPGRMVEDGELDHAAHIGYGGHHEEGDLHQDLHQQEHQHCRPLWTD